MCYLGVSACYLRDSIFEKEPFIMLIIRVLIRQGILSVLMWSTILVPQALACSACFFGSPQDPANKSLRLGILVMLALLALVLGLVVKFLVNFNRRAKLMES